jgi:hypothetical protein
LSKKGSGEIEPIEKEPSLGKSPERSTQGPKLDDLSFSLIGEED